MGIEHVVVLALENRSFDHMLGFLDHPDPAFAGLAHGGPYDNPGAAGTRVPASPQAKAVLPFGPDHSHDAVMEQLTVGSGGTRHPTNQGFVTNYERKARGLSRPRFGGLLGPLLNLVIGSRRSGAPAAAGRGPLVMRCQAPASVPVLSRLALDFAVCDHWFCSVPGETWPNRNYLHAATSDGETDIELRPYLDPTIFELLECNGHRWRIYHDDTPQVWAFPKLWDTPQRHGNWFPSTKFAEHAADGNLATYSFIEPNHRPPFHALDDGPDEGNRGLGTSQHPENNLVANDDYDSYVNGAETDFSRGEALIAYVYESLRANPALFERTMLVVTYDEHGGLYDHVPPPTGVPAPADPQSLVARLLSIVLHRKASAFDFTMLGPRVPAVIVSPLIAAGTLDARTRDHASVPATMRALFAPAAAPLTARDAWSAPFHDLLTLTQPRTDLPDLSAYVRPLSPPDDPPVPARAARPPAYYADFVEQADAVRRHLAEVGEPEVASVASARDPQGAADVTAAFNDAAHRHRHQPAGSS